MKQRMTALRELNRRHRVALFLTLVAAGTSLVLEFGPLRFAGVVLIGIAFAWAFGSDNRLVHGAFLFCGLSLVICPMAYLWIDCHWQATRYSRRLEQFERKLPELAKLYPLPKTSHLDTTEADDRGLFDVLTRQEQEELRTALEKRLESADANSHAADKERFGKALLWLARAMSDPKPTWYQRAVAAGADPRIVPDEERPGDKPTPFSFSLAAKALSSFIVCGLSLSFLGAGLLIGLRGGTRDPRISSPGSAS